nr:hypothetical protein [Tanacetum cinerariifolium]
MWMVELKMIVNSVADVRHWTSKQEDPQTDFASWKQRIRLYCQGKENGVNILKSIDEGPFQMGTVRETHAKGTEGAPHLGPERPRVYSELSPEEKDRHMGQCEDAPGRFRINQRRPGITTGRFVKAIKLNRGLRNSNYDQLYAYLKQHEAHTNENKMMLDRFTEHTVDPLALMVVVQNVQGRQNRGQGTNPRGGGAAGYGGAHNRVGHVNPGQARQIKCYNCNADDCDTFDSNVDEAPTAQTMFIENLSSADPAYDEAGPSYDSNILSEHNTMNDLGVGQSLLERE